MPFVEKQVAFSPFVIFYCCLLSSKLLLKWNGFFLVIWDTQQYDLISLGRICSLSQDESRQYW